MHCDPTILSAEEWRPIGGFEGLYEVSDLGRVRRVARGHGTWIGKILSLCDDNRGYWRVKLGRDGHWRDYSIHVLVATAFIGPKPSGCDVDHIDGVRKNNIATNLEWVTRSENIQRAYRRHGGGWTENRGEANGHAKLCAADVLTIRTLHGHRTAASVAAEYGIEKSRIYKIWARTVWKHL